MLTVLQKTLSKSKHARSRLRVSFITFGHAIETSLFCRCQLNALLVSGTSSKEPKDRGMKRKIKTTPFAVALYMGGVVPDPEGLARQSQPCNA